MNNIPAVEHFVIDRNTSTNLDKKWTKYIEEFELFIVASGITDGKQKVALLLHLGGENLREIYKTLKEDNDKFDAVKTKLTNYFKPKKNVTYERYILKSTVQEKDESSSSYITRLKSLAQTCEFGAQRDAEVRDHFIFTCHSKSLKQKLLREENLTLDRLLEISRAKEMSEKQAAEIKGSKSEETGF